MTPPYSTLIFGMFPLHQIADVGVSDRISLKLFGREIIFKEFQPNVITVPILHVCDVILLCIIAVNAG